MGNSFDVAITGCSEQGCSCVAHAILHACWQQHHYGSNCVGKIESNPLPHL